MFRIALRSLAFVLALLVAGCGSLRFDTSADETATWSAQRLYTEAKEAMADGDYARAIQYFQRLEARYPFGRYAQQAQLEVAYAYYRENDPAQAIAACDRFIKLHPNHPSVDYAYYLKGVVNFYEDQSLLAQFADQDATERDPRSARDSFAAFKDLATKFPDSKYTPDALARLNFLVNALASHEVHVARYYMSRGAYLAAANRAQYTVKTYPEAPAVEEALYIMVQAYERMGMKDLRDDAERVLVKNFPKSPWLSGTHVRADKSWWQLWK
jgi:outer membrane protein assembly factor BamD